MAITTTGISHLRLTVTDIDASRAFYDRLFGWDVMIEVPPDADEETREQLDFVYGGVIYASPSGAFGLRPVAPGGDSFSEDRVGLDHLALTVGSRDDLDAAVGVLDELGVTHEGVKDIGMMYILEFRDPDNIALELAAAKG